MSLNNLFGFYCSLMMMIEYLQFCGCLVLDYTCLKGLININSYLVYSQRKTFDWTNVQYLCSYEGIR